MSIETRANSYGKIFGEWSICPTPIGKGSHSGGSEATVVYKLTRSGHKFTEECAMKIVNIISKEGNYQQASKDEKNKYREECEDKCEKAEEEVKLMYELRRAANIVSYLDYKVETWEEENGYGCDLLIRMDLLDGSLQEELKEGKRFSEQEIVCIGMDICNALKECHKRNIIHRDIKPQNIFTVEKTKEYLLGDFGISKILENRDYAVTATGTQEYIAPEQIRSQYDNRVDIYSLGLVLYQLANGNRLPFSTPSGYVNQEAIAKRISGVPLPELDGISARLSEVIMKACAFDCENRYNDADEFYGALRAIEEVINIEQMPVEEETDDMYRTLPAGKLVENLKKVTGLAAQYEEKARLGEAIAQRQLGKCYYFGHGVLQSYEEAVEWYRKSAQQADAEAQWRLGSCYHLGHGVLQSYEEAVSWYRRSAEQGNAEAQWRLGSCYYLGQGVSENVQETVKWYQKSANQGNAKASKHLKELYEII